MHQLSKIKALVEAGVAQLQVMEQLGISKAVLLQVLGWVHWLAPECFKLLLNMLYLEPINSYLAKY